MDLLEKGTVLNGDTFKGILFGQRFIKIVEEDNKEDHNTVLKQGYNEKKIEINNNTSYSYGGIKFSTIDDFYKAFSAYNDKHEYYWDIEIPDDAIISVDTDYFKTDKIVLMGVRRDIKDLEVWNDKEFCMNALKKTKKCMKYIKNPSLDLQIEYVKNDRNNIKLLDDPCEEVCLAHVSAHFHSLDNIVNQTDKIVLAALKKTRSCFKDINCMTEKLAVKIVKEYSDLFKDLKKEFQTEKVMLAALEKNINLIKDMEYQTPAVVDFVISNKISLIKFLDPKLISKDVYHEYFDKDVTILENMPTEYQTDELCYKAVKEKPMLLSHVKNKTDDICWCAIRKSPNLIKHVPKPTKEMIIFASDRFHNAIEHVRDFENVDDEIVEKFIDRKPELIKYCKNQTESICRRCLNKDGMMLEFIKEKTPELCSIATKQNYNAIQFVDPDMITSDMYVQPLKNNPRLLKDIPLELQSEELCIEVVQKDGLALEYVLKQTYKICKEAINNDSEAIKFADRNILDEELCWLAVKKKGTVMEFIPEEFQTQNVCLAGIRNFPFALQYIVKKNPGLCNEAFDRNKRTIKFIPFPTDDMWISAIGQFPDVASDIENPSISLMKEIVKVRPFLVTSFDNPPEEVIVEAVRKNHRVFDKLDECQKTEEVLEELIIHSHQELDKIDRPTVNMMITALSKSHVHIDRLKEIENDISDEDYEKICITAINNSWLAMAKIGKKNRNICLAGVRKEGLTLQDIEEEYQTEEIINEALSKTVESIKFVKNKSLISETAAINAVIHRGTLLEHIEHQTEDLCCMAVNDMYTALKYVKNQTDRVVREALTKNPLALEYVKDKKEDYCMQPICDKPELIKYLNEEEQTQAICYVAISSNPGTIQLIINPTEDMYIKALAKDGLIIKDIKKEDINNNLSIIAINENPMAIKHIDNPSHGLSMLAIRKDPTMIEFIKNKTEEMILYAISKNAASFSKINYQYDMLCNTVALVNPDCIPHIKDYKQRTIAEKFIDEVINLKFLEQ